MSLDSLVSAATNSTVGDGRNDTTLKFIFVGGKGGVGKSTTSSGIATLLATKCQKRVLLISTDPAHSLGDAWRQKFSNVPTRIEIMNEEDGCGGGSLDIMEVDPQQSMQGELKQWAAVSEEFFATSSSSSSSTTKSDDDNSSQQENVEWSNKMNQFQEWLSGIPGIDEATALSTAITHIESGQYDLIVFDTAPTGHTLKLLALPEILEQGIDKLQSWQTTFWTYWDALKSAASVTKAQKRASIKNQVKDMLTQYKYNIQKVAMMLQDQTRTRFVVVCIAEFLSISETQRLLQELVKKNVIASHIVVNQLVIENALNAHDLSQLESLAEVGNLQLPRDLLQKTVHACRLSTARKTIQQRYLTELKNFPETQNMLDGICEVPLLAEEVTGIEAIQRFAKLLIKQQHHDVSSMSSSRSSCNVGLGGKLYDDLIAAKNAAATATIRNSIHGDDNNDDDDETSFAPNDIVQVIGLAKSPQFNNAQGTVTTYMDKETGRYGVSIQYQDKNKTLALLPKNMVLVMRNKDSSGNNSGSKKHKVDNDNNDNHHQNDNDNNNKQLVDKAKKILDDPEIKQLMEQNPRFQAAVEDCLANPMNVLKYLGDAEMSPLISKAMSKMGK